MSVAQLEQLTPEQLAKIPIEQPPPGYKSNFDDPGIDGDLRASAIVIRTVFIVVTFAFMSARLYSRTILTKSFGYDDVVAIIAFVLAVSMWATIIWGMYYGPTPTFFVHSWNVSVLSEINTIQFWHTLEWLYFIELLPSKIALSTLYYRLFSPKRGLKAAIWLASIWATITSLTGLFGVVGMCPTYNKYKLLLCSPETRPIIVTTACMNIVTDLLLLSIPLYGVSRLNMSGSRKLALSSVFCAGILVLLSSVLNVIYRVRELYSPDNNWYYAPVNILCLFEVCASIIASSIPAIPTIFRTKGFMDATMAFSSRQWLKSSSSRKELAANACQLTPTSGEQMLVELRQQKVSTGASVVSLHQCSDMSSGKGSSDVTEERNDRGSCIGNKCMLCTRPMVSSDVWVNESGLIACRECHNI